MAQDIVHRCVDCAYFVPAVPKRERSVWATLFSASMYPTPPDFSAEDLNRCSWRRDPVTGDARMIYCDLERSSGHCGEDGAHFEPATTMQGEP
jgi:hypothetical protein